MKPVTPVAKTPEITNPQERTAATLGAFMFFIPHFMNQKTEFVTLYMRQNFGIWIISIILQILMPIFVKIAFANEEAIHAVSELGGRGGNRLNGIMQIFFFAFALISFAVTIIAFYMMFKAYKGERFEVKWLLKYTNILISKVGFLRDFFTPKTTNN